MSDDDDDDDDDDICVPCSYWTCVCLMLAACIIHTASLLLQLSFISTHEMLHCLSLVGVTACRHIVTKCHTMTTPLWCDDMSLHCDYM